MSAAPPPATTPSAMAPRVADRASSTRRCSSLSSAFVGAPTLITATLPDRDPMSPGSTASQMPEAGPVVCWRHGRGDAVGGAIELSPKLGETERDLISGGATDDRCAVGRRAD